MKNLRLKPDSFLKNIVFILCLLLVLAGKSNAQIIKAKEFKAYLSELKIENNLRSDSLRKLLLNDYSILSLDSKNNLSYYSTARNAPLCLCINAEYITMLYDANTAYADVSTIKIRVEKPNSLSQENLDLNKLTYFKKLKYVIFVYEYQPTSLPSIYTSSKTSGITVLYEVSIPC